MKKVLTACFFLLMPQFAIAAIKVGVWKENIAPVASEITDTCMGGYGLPLTKPRCGVGDIHDYLSVRAIYIEGRNKNEQLSMLVFDASGLGDSMINDIRKRVDVLSDRIDTDNLIVIATHTHAGLDFQGIWGGVSQGYRDRIIDMAARTVVQAQVTSQSVNAYVSKARIPVSNRRGWEQVDNGVTTLFFDSKLNGQRVATLVNASAHPTILDKTNYQYSSDYIYSLRSRVEGSRGGLTIFVNGILGDAQFDVSERTFDKAIEVGNLVADAVIKSERKRKKVRGSLKVSTISFSHPVSNNSIIGLQKMGELDLNLDKSNRINVDMKYARLGHNVSLLSFPGEALTGLGLPIKRMMGGKYKIFLGLANASYGYFIPSEEYGKIPNRNTEEMFCMDKDAADNIKEVIKAHLR